MNMNITQIEDLIYNKGFMIIDLSAHFYDSLQRTPFIDIKLENRKYDYGVYVKLKCDSYDKMITDLKLIADVAKKGEKS